MTPTATAPKRGVLASFALLLVSMMLSGQASAFDVGGFSYDVINATDVEVTGCVPASCEFKKIVIPATASDGSTSYSVTSIGVNAFSGNFLASVTIPDSVTSIEAYTFANNALASVTIPKTVETIGYGSFGGNRLTSVTIPDSVASIGDYAFFSNVLTSVAFLGDFGAFSLDIFKLNEDLASITYCQGAAGWPQTFMRAEKDSLTAEEVDCAAPVPAVTPLATVGWPGRAAVGADMVGLPCSFCRR